MIPYLRIHESQPRKLEPSRWKIVRIGPCEVRHWAYVQVLYLGTRTQYEFLCGLDVHNTALSEEEGDRADCVVCLSREHATDDPKEARRCYPGPG